MSKVVGLFGGSPVNEPSRATIRQIEDLLARAKSGEIRAIGFVTVNSGGGAGTGWCAEAEAKYALTAGAAILHARIVQDEIDHSRAYPDLMEDDGA